jgi:hypothetical protein
LLFASFPSGFNAASWPIYSSMSCEAALKPAEKYIENHIFNIKGYILEPIQAIERNC